MVITRSVSLHNQPVSYQLCRQPIPLTRLDLEDLSDGEMRVGGSIRGAFSNTERSQYEQTLQSVVLQEVGFTERLPALWKCERI